MKDFNHIFRWPRLTLKSPGTKPRTLPGKQHPNPLPSIGKSGGRPSKEEISPLGSPGFGSPVAVFRQSPVSTPVTPGYQTSPRTEEGGVGSFREDPVKVSVILPQVISTLFLITFPPLTFLPGTLHICSPSTPSTCSKTTPIAPKASEGGRSSPVATPRALSASPSSPEASPVPAAHISPFPSGVSSANDGPSFPTNLFSASCCDAQVD